MRQPTVERAIARIAELSPLALSHGPSSHDPVQVLNRIVRMCETVSSAMAFVT